MSEWNGTKTPEHICWSITYLSDTFRCFWREYAGHLSVHSAEGIAKEAPAFESEKVFATGKNYGDSGKLLVLEKAWYK